MLIISRKASESFFIGDDIEVTVVSVSGGNVRIAIKAPREVEIFRKELMMLKRYNANAEISDQKSSLADFAQALRKRDIVLEPDVLPTINTYFKNKSVSYFQSNNMIKSTATPEQEEQIELAISPENIDLAIKNTLKINSDSPIYNINSTLKFVQNQKNPTDDDDE